MRKLDWAALSVIGATILLLSGVIFTGNRVPVSVTCQLPSPCTQISPYGSVVFEFSRPVQPERVEKLWQTSPRTEGRWEWLDDQHGRWYSTKPLAAGQKIVLQFLSGPAGQNNEHVRRAIEWEATVRAPQIVGARNDEDGRGLFIFELDGESPGVRLTHANGQLYDYQVSPDGESVVFSLINDQKGVDLWMVQRDGSNERKFLDCGADRCSTPAWSPIRSELAYTRESAGLDPNGPKGAPRIWILDVGSGQTAPLFADPQEIGYGPAWSPNGEWLSIWNGLEGGIQVVNRESGDTFLLETASGDVGCWTPDSRFLYFSNMVSGEAGFRNVILRADIEDRSVSTIFGGNVEGGGLSVDDPVCSPTDKWVAVTVQPNIKIPGSELFLLNPEVKDGVSISDDLSRLPGFYSWTPDGSYLVFQTDLLGGREEDVEIWAWERKTGTATKITTGSRSPQWLP